MMFEELFFFGLFYDNRLAFISDLVVFIFQHLIVFLKVVTGLGVATCERTGQQMFVERRLEG